MIEMIVTNFRLKWSMSGLIGKNNITRKDYVRSKREIWLSGIYTLSLRIQ